LNRIDVLLFNHYFNASERKISMIKEARVTYISNANKDEMNYWNGKSFEEKLTAVQILREQYIQLFNKQNEYDESRKRLRRVYRIIK
jgi:hypothetical protein